MNNKSIHIVTHEPPFPVDFGGVFDLFYKIKTLHSLGVQIHLHCFSKDGKEQPILNRYCASVQYYPRKNTFSFSKFFLPFIVQSRINNALTKDLLKDDYPIIIEGIHCSYPVFTRKLSTKKVIVRLHNVEFNYYRQLARYEKNLIKKCYFLIESVLLFFYEKKLSANASFWTVSELDKTIYHQKFHSSIQMDFIPVFLPWNDVNSSIGVGNYCLYHGNLSINENEKAVTWLIKHVFSKIHVPFVVAGKNPSKRLKKTIYSYQHTCLVENPSEFEMDDLIKKAQINILPSFNKTGVKLKILNALYNGRYCVTNQIAITGTGLEEACVVNETSEEFIKKIQELMTKPYEKNDIKTRQVLLDKVYNNTINAMKIISWMNEC